MRERPGLTHCRVSDGSRWQICISFKSVPHGPLIPFGNANHLSAPLPRTEPLANDSQFGQHDRPVQWLRSGCRGAVPLDGVLASWMVDVLCQPSIHQWVEQFESPLNVLCEAPLEANVRALAAVAGDRNLDLQIHFARKANKCLRWIDVAKRLGIAIDVASGIELQQTLERGIEPAKIICTAAVKPVALLQQCVDHGVTIVIDNTDELLAIQSVASRSAHAAKIAIRMSGFQHRGQKLSSRFGIDVDDFASVVGSGFGLLADPSLAVVGLHFHLDGSSIAQRVTAIEQVLPWVDELNRRGQQIKFIDMGGGIPVRYLQSQDQWTVFHQEHERSLLGLREAITLDRHGLGRIAGGGNVFGKLNSYPMYQAPVSADWFSQLLDHQLDPIIAAESSVADAIRRRGLQLRCEPGRSLLDGCGMTVARVEFCKKHPSGYALIGLSMNRTQCRTTDDEFLVDPILLTCAGVRSTSRLQSVDGFFVGAYCTESEYLSLRRFHFPHGVARGDLIVFPNTAGYQMHFMESRSHQFPLAKNVFLQQPALDQASLDPIDR
ncbi:Diaminopimelate decarboxylase [Novipirellula galeiformis]|uniref:Diaminopimelate decarboxylase n=1 Tax=Novipirellula galeiformis TaxID=2528004 RepID=A0A5C6CE09_9BACT|nr:Diaminopimelate decarboxylase [Novipirellula galeiformis]